MAQQPRSGTLCLAAELGVLRWLLHPSHGFENAQRQSTNKIDFKTGEFALEGLKNKEILRKYSFEIGEFACGDIS